MAQMDWEDPESILQLPRLHVHQAASLCRLLHSRYPAIALRIPTEHDEPAAELTSAIQPLY